MKLVDLIDQLSYDQLKQLQRFFSSFEDSQAELTSFIQKFQFIQGFDIEFKDFTKQKEINRIIENLISMKHKVEENVSSRKASV